MKKKLFRLQEELIELQGKAIQKIHNGIFDAKYTDDSKHVELERLDSIMTDLIVKIDSKRGEIISLKKEIAEANEIVNKF